MLPLRPALRVGLAGAFAWLSADVISGLAVQWATSPDASYGAILATVALLLLWQRRAAFRGTPLTWGSFTAALLLLTLGLFGYVAGQFAADLFTTRASVVIVAGGLIWFLLGTPAARAACAPLVFLLLAIPLPELVVTTMTGSLQTVAASGAGWLLARLDIPVFRTGNVLELPSATLQVVEACSGLRSVVSLAAVGILLAWSTDGSLPRRVCLVLLTTPLAVAVNAVRLAASGAAAERWGAVALHDPWHSLAGWLTFLVSLTALWLVQRALFASASLPSPRLQAVRV